MKTLLASVVVLAGLMLWCGGCATPAYSAHERQQLINRNQSYEFAQAVDDWDSFWLTRPASHLTIWHVQ
jgi:hypothetical protein